MESPSKENTENTTDIKKAVSNYKRKFKSSNLHESERKDEKPTDIKRLRANVKQEENIEMRDLLGSEGDFNSKDGNASESESEVGLEIECEESRMQEAITDIDFHRRIRQLEFRLGQAESYHDLAEQGKFLNRLGLLYQERGYYDKAIEYHERDAELARRLHDQEGLSLALRNIAFSLRMLRRFHQALTKLKESLNAAKRAGSVEEMQRTHVELGNVYEAIAESEGFPETDPFDDRTVVADKPHEREIKNHEIALNKALKHFQQSLELTKSLDEAQVPDKALMIVDAFFNLGRIYRDKGSFRLALDFFRKSLKAAQQSSNFRLQEGRALHGLGTASLMLGNSSDAELYFRRDIAICEQECDFVGQADSLVCCGQALLEQKKFVEASKCFREARDLILVHQPEAKEKCNEYSKNAKVSEQYVQMTMELSQLQKKLQIVEQGKEDLYIMQLKEAIELADAVSTPELVSELTCKLLETVSRLEDKKLMAEAHFILGSLAYREKRWDEAVQHFREEFRMWTQLGEKTHQIEALNEIGNSLESLGRPQSDVVVAYEQALRLATEENLPFLQKMILENLEFVFSKHGDMIQVEKCRSKLQELRNDTDEAQSGNSNNQCRVNTNGFVRSNWQRLPDTSRPLLYGNLSELLSRAVAPEGFVRASVHGRRAAHAFYKRSTQNLFEYSKSTVFNSTRHIVSTGKSHRQRTQGHSRNDKLHASEQKSPNMMNVDVLLRAALQDSDEEIGRPSGHRSSTPEISTNYRSPLKSMKETKQTFKSRASSNSSGRSNTKKRKSVKEPESARLNRMHVVETMDENSEISDDSDNQIEKLAHTSTKQRKYLQQLESDSDDELSIAKGKESNKLKASENIELSLGGVTTIQVEAMGIPVTIDLLQPPTTIYSSVLDGLDDRFCDESMLTFGWLARQTELLLFMQQGQFPYIDEFRTFNGQTFSMNDTLHSLGSVSIFFKNVFLSLFPFFFFF